MTELTIHGAQRAKERAGLHIDSAMRIAARAWELGLKPNDVSGQFRRYLDGIARKGNSVPRVWGHHVYVFGVDGALITVLPLERKFHTAATKRLKEGK